MPRTYTQTKVSQCATSVGRCRPKNSAPTASSTTAWPMLDTSTTAILPTKYALRGIGVPRSRLSVPFARSPATCSTMLWKDVDMMPTPSMPVT